MLRNFQVRIAVIALAVLTLAAIVLASINYTHENQFQVPTDGVWWTDASGGLVAQRVFKSGSGERAGILNGDLLIAVNDQPVTRFASLQRELYRAGIYSRVSYTLVRSGIHLDVPVILIPQDRSINPGLRLIALIYLLIGLYVLFRRWTAPRATHFYIFCLASFVLYAFIYTGKLNLFDWIIYWGNVFAGVLQPALLLHFAFTFPEEKAAYRRQRWLIGLTYLPGIALLGLNIVAVLMWSATEALIHRMNQISLAYLAFFYVLAAAVFFVNYRRANNPLMRQQLKWLTRGTIIAVAPFTVFYVLPYLAGASTNGTLNHISVLCLVLLPLTFSYAIVRYRLMDVDLIFKRGVTYTLATAALVGLYFGAVALAGEVVGKRLPAAGGWGLAGAIIVFALLFDPIKRAIQDRVDRIFDRKRYDYRETLIEFARDLNSQTDLGTLVAAIVDRLPRTLLVARVAVFLADEKTSNSYTFAAAQGVPSALRTDFSALDLSFLDFDRIGAATHMFFESTQHAPHLTPSQQYTVRHLDFNYYLPCYVQRRTIAVIGLGRTTGGDFLSSEDIELLETLASYIGIAIQNARLYASLAEKVSEYERLKEFNENIVESINIGILAVDLEDCVDSWNAQMEAMYAVSRSEALRQPLTALFPADFIAEYERVKNDPGVHTLYKFRVFTRSGEVRTANIALAPLLDKDFKAVGRIILVDDITERVQLETQLMQADKLSSIGLLAAGVAHEVNTPLAVISSYTQMLAKQVREDERLSQLLDKITQQTFRASEIVNGLLNFSRTSGTEFKPLNMNHVLRETLILLEHQFRTSGITLELYLDDALPEILGHTGKLQQVFLNLFLNAKDAMAGGGVLRVTTVANSHVAVEIADSGSGIAQENLRRIYDPFFTTKSSPREGQRRGTGLGLAVSYGIIQEHAGKIHVESEVGSGTTFHLEFPILRKAVHA
ncbi:MAG TPA: ATP-binding protein [Acidobacteriaceae bacterium]|nr:ATP-binding protein [Acidobacteriaceae bacterium]